MNLSDLKNDELYKNLLNITNNYTILTFVNIIFSLFSISMIILNCMVANGINVTQFISFIVVNVMKIKKLNFHEILKNVNEEDKKNISTIVEPILKNIKNDGV